MYCSCKPLTRSGTESGKKSSRPSGGTLAPGSITCFFRGASRTFSAESTFWSRPSRRRISLSGRQDPLLKRWLPRCSRRLTSCDCKMHRSCKSSRKLKEQNDSRRRPPLPQLTQRLLLLPRLRPRVMLRLASILRRRKMKGRTCIWQSLKFPLGHRATHPRAYNLKTKMKKRRHL